MKISKKQVFIGIISIIIFLSALILCILDWALPLNIYVHPTLTFLLVIFGGFGLMAFIFAVCKKSPWFFFCSALLLGPALLYIIINYLEWWIAMLSMVVFWIICVVLSVTICGNKTEAVAENASPDYKDYKQRKQEKEEKEAAIEEQPLPEIKSFKK